MVLGAQEELEEILQRTQSAWMYYSSEKDRLEKYFFMFEKSGSQNKKHVLKSGRIAQSKRDTSVTCDILGENAADPQSEVLHRVMV